MKEQTTFKRRGRLVSRWSATVSAMPLRAFAESFSQTAREAFAETNSITIERHEIKLRRLPKELNGLRVVQLTDVHHSPFTDTAQIMRAVEVANSLEADLIALTGDYVSHEVEYVAPMAEMLGKLRAKHGVYAILGNHDHWTDAEFVTKCLRDEGIKVLINEGLRFSLKGGSFWLCGLDDTMAGKPDLHATLEGSHRDEMKFLLCHNPAILNRATRAGIDLILSGHTHGGQIKINREKENHFFKQDRRMSGLHRRHDTQIYVSRGIGTVVVPVRYQCPPEVSLLELRPTDI